MGDVQSAEIPEGATDEEIAQYKFQAIQAAIDATFVNGNTYATLTPQGEVRIGQIICHLDGALCWVDVWLTSRTGYPGDPNYIFSNPPLLTLDPAGDVEINGQRYREDPLRGIADAIASLGGASPIRHRSAQA